MLLTSENFKGIPEELNKICTSKGWCLCETNGHEDGDWQITIFEDNKGQLDTDEKVHLRVGILALSENPRQTFRDAKFPEILAARYALQIISYLNYQEYNRIVLAVLNHENSPDLL